LVTGWLFPFLWWEVGNLPVEVELEVKVARLGEHPAWRPVNSSTWQPSPGPATIDRREGQSHSTRESRLDNAPGTQRQAAEPSETISRGGDRASGANHPSETHKKGLRKPFSGSHRCLYKQLHETFTSVDVR
jgi:hypothetical protein